MSNNIHGVNDIRRNNQGGTYSEAFKNMDFFGGTGGQ